MTTDNNNLRDVLFYVMKSHENPFENINVNQINLSYDKKKEGSSEKTIVSSYDIDLVTEQYGFNTVEEMIPELMAADNFLYNFFSKVYIGDDMKFKGNGNFDMFNHLGIQVMSINTDSSEEKIKINWFISVEK